MFVARLALPPGVETTGTKLKERQFTWNTLKLQLVKHAKDQNSNMCHHVNWVKQVEETEKFERAFPRTARPQAKGRANMNHIVLTTSFAKPVGTNLYPSSFAGPADAAARN